MCVCSEGGIVLATPLEEQHLDGDRSFSSKLRLWVDWMVPVQGGGGLP